MICLYVKNNWMLSCSVVHECNSSCMLRQRLEDPQRGQILKQTEILFKSYGHILIEAEKFSKVMT